MYACFVILVLHNGGISPKPFATPQAPSLSPKAAVPRPEAPTYLQTIALGAYWTYRATLSAAKGPNCVFKPSCSAFGKEAIAAHGLIAGLFLFAARLLRAHVNYGEWLYPNVLGEPWLSHSLHDATSFLNHPELLPWTTLFASPSSSR
jgi:putative component of membrane protein insertase Oxa1/YidC/SpoIIIJ protein YidD